jgi:hypothetical protein
MGFFSKKSEDTKKSTEAVQRADIGRNDPCHCGSGKKYKKCHADKDAATEHNVLEKQWQVAEKEAAKKAEEEKKNAAKEPANTPPKPGQSQNVTGQKRNTLAIPKFNAPRRTGGG